MTTEVTSEVSGSAALDAGSRESLHLAVLALWVVAVSSIFAPTLASMVATWSTSETFTHGFLVAPLSLWLAWRMRDRLVPLMEHGPSPLLLVAAPPAVLLWLAGSLVSVQVVMQISYVALLIVGLAALMGYRAARVAAFPLGFLLLAVPMGIELEQPMMDLTAKYTVELIRITGIPVYQEGRFFELPTGSWSVVEACSGVRYLIASFTLGLLFAHISYRTIGRKLAFIAASIAVPVLANVARAYLIVMLGHLSNMQLATGVDHLIYGWIFFGLVMLLLFWVGGWWAESDAQPDRAEVPEENPVATTGATRGGRLWSTLAIAMLVAITAPTVIAWIDAKPVAMLEEFPAISSGGWRCEKDADARWQPSDGDADRRVSVACTAESTHRISVTGDQYLRQEQGREVADYFSGLNGNSGEIWRTLASTPRAYELESGGELRATEAQLRSNRDGQHIMVIAWFLVDAEVTSNGVGVKIAEALHKLRGTHRVSSRVFVALPYPSWGEGEARQALDDFLFAHGHEINTALSAVRPGGRERLVR